MLDNTDYNIEKLLGNYALSGIQYHPYSKKAILNYSEQLYKNFITPEYLAG